jgi:two-component system KDP operon response regulator KdpE
MMDGMAALYEVRLCSSVPVIMLTVNGDEDAKVQALRLGADEYVTTPCSQRELLAHIESMLRRSTQTGSVPQEIVMVDDDLTIDFARNRVILRGTENPLTATEHRLLYHLVSNAGRLMPFEALLARVWGPDYREEVHYVRLYVSYLRAKIEPDPAHPKYILIEKGLGYRFAALEREPPRQQARRDVSDPAWHELKTLVAMVRAYIETLLQGIERGEDRDGVRILRHIEARATRMLNMVDRLLEAQRIQSGVLALDESWFDLCELAAGVAEEFQATTQSHRLVVDSMEPVLVRADRRRIGMVLSNLLENAIDYSPGGGVITETVRLGTRPDGRGKQAVMAVSDQGMGITPADLPHVFERYFQTAGGRPRDGGLGLGAGLFVARGIVQQHGGSMWVKSGGTGGGSTFYLTLPT